MSLQQVIPRPHFWETLAQDVPTKVPITIQLLVNSMQVKDLDTVSAQ